MCAQRGTAARHLAVDLYDQLHAWVGGAVERGIGSEEFADCDVAALSTLLLALCDGLGIRLMLGDPRVDLAAARETVWRAIPPRSASTSPFRSPDRSVARQAQLTVTRPLPPLPEKPIVNRPFGGCCSARPPSMITCEAPAAREPSPWLTVTPGGS